MRSNKYSEQSIQISPERRERADFYDFVSREEMQIARTPQDCIIWFWRRDAEIDGNEKYKRAWRVREGIFKYLCAETFFLVRFLEQWKNADLIKSVQHIIGSQNYDFKIHFHNGLSKLNFNFIEITEASYDKDEKWRGCIMNECGTVVANGVIKDESRMHTGRSISTSILDTHSLNVEVICEKVKSRIDKKISKRYPENTALVVAVEDNKFLTNDSEGRLEIKLKRLLSDYSENDTFSCIFIVGTSKRIFLSSRDLWGNH